MKNAADAIPASAPSGTAACGQVASQLATSEHRAPAAPAALRTVTATPDDSGSIASPTSPRRSATDTNGPARMFASGEMSDTIPNVAIVSGTVAAWATNVMATGSETKRAGPGSARRAQRSASLANSSRPATAATDS